MKKPLSSLDLNLLLCLQLLTQELSVTRTAKRMNVSPSAVSKSLAKLRAWFVFKKRLKMQMNQKR